MTLKRKRQGALRATPRGWRDLGKEFADLGKRSRIEVFYYPDGGQGLGGVSVAGVEGEWEIHPGLSTPADVREFQRLARGAAVAAGCKDHPDSWANWLDGIRRNELGEVKDGTWNFTHGDAPSFDVRSTTYKAICGVSAQYCRFIASGAAAPPLCGAPEPKAERATEDENCSWSEVKIEFTSGEQLQITVKGQRLPARDYRAMGFENIRSRTPRKAWSALLLLADNRGEFKAEFKERKHFEKRIQEIRRLLRAHLQQEGFMFPPNSDPLPCKNGNYRTAFVIERRSYRE